MLNSSVKLRVCWVVLTCTFTCSHSCCFLLHHADASRSVVKVSLLRLTSDWSMATVDPCSQRPHQVNSERYPILKPLYCTVFGRLAWNTQGGFRMWECGRRVGGWEKWKGLEGEKMRGCRGQSWEHRVEFQREKERSENEGGTKEKDRRWEEKSAERSEQRRGVEREILEWKGKKTSGEITRRTDMENYYWSGLACFFSSLFFTSLLHPSSLIVFLLRIPPPPLRSLSSVSLLFLFSPCNLPPLQPFHRYR